jgi:hypothetical protein
MGGIIWWFSPATLSSSEETLVTLVERCGGATWQDVAAKVSRIGYWEFEDYAQTDEAG